MASLGNQTRTLLLLLIAFLLPPSGAQAAARSFEAFLQDVGQQAVASGVSRATVRNALASVEFNDRVIALDHKQPEKTITFKKYARNVVTRARIKQGKALLRRHRKVLREIEHRYGVEPSVIVALWGMETNFGHNIGGFDILSSLATLAYDGRRADFFRREMIDALRILDREHMHQSIMRGSWAGAMGQCQFMPDIYLRYAVDFNGDGRRDIWNTTDDVLASIANYLAAAGWRSDLTWGREVKLKRRLPAGEIGLETEHMLAEWEKRGVRKANGAPLPKRRLQASLVQPDGPHGRSFIVYDNFRALMRWNRSTYFASAVGLLADRIRAAD